MILNFQDTEVVSVDRNIIFLIFFRYPVHLRYKKTIQRLKLILMKIYSESLLNSLDRSPSKSNELSGLAGRCDKTLIFVIFIHDIADNLFKAFSTFKSRYDGSMQVRKDEPAPAKPAEAAPAKPKEEPQAANPVPEAKPQGPRYGTQILVTSKAMDLNDPFFAGYKPVLVKSGKYNKYIVGVSSSQADYTEHIYTAGAGSPADSEKSD